MSSTLFRKYIDMIAENEATNLYHGDFEPANLSDPKEKAALTGGTVAAWAKSLNLDLASAQTGLYTLDGGLQVPAIKIPLQAALDPKTFADLQRGVGGAGIRASMEDGQLTLIKTR